MLSAERSPRAFTVLKPAQPFSLELWSRIEGNIYRKILAHPFITGLQDGSLPENSFRHYIIQDALYLRQVWLSEDEVAGGACATGSEMGHSCRWHFRSPGTNTCLMAGDMTL